MAKCADCTYLNLEDFNDDGEYWCDKKCERHLATDPECGSFCKAYSRSSGAISNAISYSKSKTEPDCYLTTMLCNILNLPDDNIYLETIRNFRKNVLQKDEKYKALLVEYDIVGPVIANALANDPLRETIAKVYLNNFIIPITQFINNKENDRAVDKYYQMTNNLKTFYGLNNYNVSVKEIDNADIGKSGHGKYIQKKITLQ